jgi:aminopeptidase N
LIYLSTLSYLDPRDRPAFASDPYQRIFFSDILVAHEVAHQWWGNQVASTGYQDEWLMEALANYSALMLLEKRKGPKAVDEVLEMFREHLLAKTAAGKTVEATGPIRLGLRLESSEAPGAWRTITYEKGTWILHMLRRRLGDAAWNQLLGRIAREYRGKRLRVREFLAEAAGLLPATDPDPRLENFAGTWIEGTGIPTLRLIPGKVAGQGVIEQSGVDEDFSVDVPVEIQYRGGKSETRWVRTEGASTSYPWKLAGPVLRITLDPQSAVLAIKQR